MNSLLEQLRASRKNPAVLRLKVLKIRGESPDILIFVYEGPDDIPVYEEWMRRISGCPAFESIAGAGKEQLLAYHASLSQSSDPILDKVFFFVDRDFDMSADFGAHVFELGAYSIENLLCTEDVLESILRDEFRRSGRIMERARVIGKYVELRQQFISHCNPIDWALFAARRLGLKVLKKPEKLAEIVDLSLVSISRSYVRVADIVSIEGDYENHKQAPQLRDEFSAFPDHFAHRGKYLMEMFRRWLRALADDLRSTAPILFESSESRLPGELGSIPLRRLAASTPIPPELSIFVHENILPACRA